MPGLSHALVPAQESKRWSFGRLLLLPVIQKGLFLGPKKSRKLDTQIRASPVDYLQITTSEVIPHGYDVKGFCECSHGSVSISEIIANAP